MSKFQIILLTIFGLFILGAVVVFSVYRGSGKTQVNLTVWGPLTEFEFSLLSNSASFKATGIATTYVQVPEDEFAGKFTEALAEGKGPDLVILSQAEILENQTKLALIPYSTVNQGDFTSTFIEEGNLFTNPNGIYALPLQVDPLVMYYNKDLLDTAAISQPIKYWDEIYTYINKLTIKDDASNITQSTIALGESKNIPHAKDVLSLLLLQAGTPIVSDNTNGYKSEISNSFNLPVTPGNAALDFYTQFSNPAKPFYTWNRALPAADTSFIAGDSAFYIGYASEEKSLKQKNPNLPLGITSVPQSRASGKNITFGNLYGIAVVKNSQNQAGALTGLLALISNEAVSILLTSNGLPPARRDLLAVRPSESDKTVFYDAALQSRGWLDPMPTKTSSIFGDLIDSVTSGRLRIDQALQGANDSLNSLLP